MHRNPGEFAQLLEAAAEDIGRQTRHPGQIFPGVWPVDSTEHSPERLIGMVAAAALARVCHQQGADLDSALASYVEVSKDVPLVPKGGPDVMAAQHMRDSAAALLVQAGLESAH